MGLIARYKEQKLFNNLIKTIQYSDKPEEEKKELLVMYVVLQGINDTKKRRKILSELSVDNFSKVWSLEEFKQVI